MLYSSLVSLGAEGATYAVFSMNNLRLLILHTKFSLLILALLVVNERGQYFLFIETANDKNSNVSRVAV